jgi:hypothetical protein
MFFLTLLVIGFAFDFGGKKMIQRTLTFTLPLQVGCPDSSLVKIKARFWKTTQQNPRLISYQPSTLHYYNEIDATATPAANGSTTPPPKRCSIRIRAQRHQHATAAVPSRWAAADRCLRTVALVLRIGPRLQCFVARQSRSIVCVRQVSHAVCLLLSRCPTCT